MASHYRLSFTIGPVQSFVAQARRSKDYWSGSWLLSYLAECALVAAEQDGGEVIIPHRPESKTLVSLRRAVGAIPNRFELRFSCRQAALDSAARAKASFNVEWNAICQAIWDDYIDAVTSKFPESNTREIWDRQIDGFWELAWVATPESDQNQLAGKTLQARKYCRIHAAGIEQGTKCTLMNDLQEISGFYGRGQWEKQSQFWSVLRKGLARRENATALDLGDGERLCSIAIVKRLLPNIIGRLPLAKEHQANKPAPETIKENLSERSHWPSLGFIAALPWLDTLEADGLAVDTRAQFVSDAQSEDRVAWEAEKRRNSDATLRSFRYWPAEIRPAEHFGVPWARVDASAWFKTGLINNEPKLSEAKQRSLLSQLQTIYDQADCKPCPYYALLMMDGDSMGQLLNKLENSTLLSNKLGEFSQQVEDIVRAHRGRSVYAGGDDVLAFVSAEHALAAATALARTYAECFAETKAKGSATLSGAILFAHWRYPLSQVTRMAHEFLDDVAKAATGRDSLAITIVQGSGLNSLWSAPWTMITADQSADGAVAGVTLETLVAQFDASPVDQELQNETPAEPDGSESGEDEFARPLFNASFLYNLRQQFSGLFPKSTEDPGTFQRLGDVDADGEQMILNQLAHSEFRRRMTRSERQRFDRSVTQPRIDAFMSLSQRWYRSADEAEPDRRRVHCDKYQFTFDGWRIARFLNQVERGELPDHE